MRLASFSSALLTLAIVSCGSSGSDVSNGGAEGEPAGDAGGRLGSDDGGTGRLPDGEGGSIGAAGGGSDGGATEGCPTYQALCNGKCVSVVSGPDNCGGCGVTCADGQVCSGGACTDSCLPGLTGCSGACVDLFNDSAHCGQCGHDCGVGQGCVAGACVPALGSTTSAQCVGSGPPIRLGDTTAGCVAQTTFTWALCSCRDVNMAGRLQTDAYDSTKGPYAPGGLGGGVGANNSLASSGGADISGALWLKGAAPLATVGNFGVKLQTRVASGVAVSGGMSLEDDAYVNGDFVGVGAISVKKQLTVPPGATVVGVSYGSLVHAPVDVPTPCDCAPEKLLPISSWISAAAAKNDNASIGITPDILAAGRPAPARIDLPCGVYYLSSIASATPVTIAAHGNTALFIAGDIAATGALSFVVDPTGQFDVVVGGTVATVGSMVVGSPSYPALSRLYVGSTGDLAFTGGWRIAANIYAATASNRFAANYSIYGSLFAGDFAGAGGATIHYDRAVVSGGLCDPPSAPPGPSDGDGGGPPPACTSCKDCGNQACNGGTCGSCATDADCCAPLQCVGGECKLITVK